MREKNRRRRSRIETTTKKKNREWHPKYSALPYKKKRNPDRECHFTDSVNSKVLLLCWGSCAESSTEPQQRDRDTLCPNRASLSDPPLTLRRAPTTWLVRQRDRDLNTVMPVISLSRSLNNQIVWISPPTTKIASPPSYTITIITLPPPHKDTGWLQRRNRRSPWRGNF